MLVSRNALSPLIHFRMAEPGPVANPGVAHAGYQRVVVLAAELGWRHILLQPLAELGVERGPAAPGFGSRPLNQASVGAENRTGVVSIQVVQEFCQVATRQRRQSLVLPDIARYISLVFPPLLAVHTVRPRSGRESFSSGEVEALLRWQSQAGATGLGHQLATVVHDLALHESQPPALAQHAAPRL